MKKLIVALTAIGVLLSPFSALAADEAVKTIKGEAQCAKCSLKKADACTDVIVAKEDGKEVTYYLAKTEATKGFHKKICQDKVKVKAKGTVKEVDGKKQLAAKQIDIVKEQ